MTQLCQGAAEIVVDGLDALIGHEALDGLGDERRAVVGADLLSNLLANSRGED